MNPLKRNFDPYADSNFDDLLTNVAKKQKAIHSEDIPDYTENNDSRIIEIVEKAMTGIKNNCEVVINTDNNTKVRNFLLKRLEARKNLNNLNSVMLVFRPHHSLPTGTSARMRAGDYLERNGNMSISFKLGIHSKDEWESLINKEVTLDSSVIKIGTLITKYHNINPINLSERNAALVKLEKKLDVWLKEPHAQSSPLYYDILELKARTCFKSEYLKKIISLDYKPAGEKFTNKEGSAYFNKMIKRITKLKKGESLYESEKSIPANRKTAMKNIQPRSLESHSLMEQIDPLHRPWSDKNHRPIFQEWEKEKNQDSQTPPFLIWLETRQLIPAAKPAFDGTQTNSNQRYHTPQSTSTPSLEGVIHTTVYLGTPEERAPYRLTLDKGLFKQSEGLPLDTTSYRSVQEGFGWAIAVQFLDGTFYAGQHLHHSENQYSIEAFHHSSFAAGGDLCWAGLFKVEEGELKAISNQSGHYFTDSRTGYQKQNGDTLQMLQTLRDSGVNLVNVTLELINVEKLEQIVQSKTGGKAYALKIPVEKKYIFNCSDFLLSGGKCPAISGEISEKLVEIAQGINTIISMMQKEGISLEDIEVTLDLPESFYFPDDGSNELKGALSMSAQDFRDEFVFQ